MKLRIDAGHGGKDTGAASGGYVEKDLTLILAKRLRVLLAEYNPRMTRTYDTDLFWDTRAGMIRNSDDEVCLSLHLNGYDGKARGVEAIHSIHSTRGKEIATHIMEAIHELGIPKRPRPVYSKTNSSGGDYYYMHRLTGSTTTVIVEALFLDNDLDKLFLNMEKLAQAIAKGFREFMKGAKIPVEAPKDSPRTIAKYGSYIHVYETTKNMHVAFDLGERFKLETVTKIMTDRLAKGEKILAGINGGFFTGAGNEHTTEFINDGLYYNPPSPKTVEMTYYKDGHTEVTNRTGYDKQVLSKIQNDSYWSIGSSYSLVQDGEFNLQNIGYFAHGKNREPRTMIGQKKDGTFVLVVVDGRSTVSRGVNAQEQAEIMLELGCINAVNLDGGGSSTMAITRGGKPVLYNSPSGYSQRAVGSVVLVKGV